MQAKDVMTESVVSVSADSSLADVLRLFVEEGIHGAPVVDDAERIVGSVSSMDLLRAEDEERDTAWATSDYLREFVEFSSPDWSCDLSDFQNRLAQRKVSDVMTPHAVTVSRTAGIDEVARCLREHRVHRVWVADGDRLFGVISALDLMPVLEKLAASS